MNDSQRALIIVIKNPVLGKVKTRIASDTGEKKALEIYHQLLDHTRKVCSPLEDTTLYLYYSDFIAQDNWPEERFIKRLQRGNDLGERMYYAFQEVLKDHRHVLLIGSDIIQLTPEILKAGFEAMETHHAVIGPSKDGGYYLLGLKGVVKDYFSGISWSMETVYKETIDRLAVHHIEPHILPLLSDVDDLEDWEQYKHLIRP